MLEELYFQQRNPKYVGNLFWTGHLTDAERKQISDRCPDQIKLTDTPQNRLHLILIKNFIKIKSPKEKLIEYNNLFKKERKFTTYDSMSPSIFQTAKETYEFSKKFFCFLNECVREFFISQFNLIFSIDQEV